MKNLDGCCVCGGKEFTDNVVLWDELISQWELKSNEVKYINRQQGLVCNQCGNNLRAMALASAVLRSYGFVGNLENFVRSDVAKDVKILEINPAGSLTSVFSELSGHRLTTYPEYDIENLNIESSTYDLVVHSDTLEHIKNPVTALSECRRVLKQDGKCIFTVPIIVDRLSRSREGLEDSYHGDKTTDSRDLIVRTEFGCDAWKYVMQAGFTTVALHCIDYPAGLAIEARL